MVGFSLTAFSSAKRSPGNPDFPCAFGITVDEDIPGMFYHSINMDRQASRSCMIPIAGHLVLYRTGMYSTAPHGYHN
jgi:hypothetical protein